MLAAVVLTMGLWMASPAQNSPDTDPSSDTGVAPHFTLWQLPSQTPSQMNSYVLRTHTGKVMVVDGAWSLVGSANWDARSLRLNFEYNVECYDEVLADELMRLIGEKMERGRSLSFEEVDARPLPARLRDGTARLLAPYL